jgi:hypothetical protein
MKTMNNWISAIILSFALSSCGFQPVYKTMHKESLPEIQIAKIDSLDGAHLYHHLSDLIGNDQSAKYELRVTLSYSSSPLVITKSSDVVEQSASQAVSYKLLDKSTQKIILSGSFVINGSYNTTASAYAAYTEGLQQQANLGLKAADEIERRLILHFAK